MKAPSQYSDTDIDAHGSEMSQGLREGTKLPAWLVRAFLAVCVLPFLLNLMGVDFASPKMGEPGLA